VHAAFARYSPEQRELQRLKATSKQSARLDYHPERLAAGTTITKDSTPEVRR